MPEPKLDRPEQVPSDGEAKESGFLDKPMSRRDVLKLAVAGSGAYLVKDWFDYQKEEREQFEIPPRIKEVFELMESLNLKLPEDKLYGFTFPTTKEMSQKFKEAIEKQVGDPTVPSLIILQERAPKTLIGSIAHLDRGITAPRVSRSISPDSPSLLYLPDYSEKDSVPETIPYIYHEGMHLFYQTGVDNSPEGTFENENIANIAQVLLGNLLKSMKHRLNNLDAGAGEAYEEAVRQNDKAIWEEYLKKLYKLPENCCTLKVPN